MKFIFILVFLFSCGKREYVTEKTTPKNISTVNAVENLNTVACNIDNVMGQLRISKCGNKFLSCVSHIHGGLFCWKRNQY